MRKLAQNSVKNAPTFHASHMHQFLQLIDSVLAAFSISSRDDIRPSARAELGLLPLHDTLYGTYLVVCHSNVV